MACRTEKPTSGIGDIQIPLQHASECVGAVGIAFLRLDPLPGIEAEQVVQSVPSGDRSVLYQVSLEQSIELCLGVLNGAVGKSGHRSGGEIGSGDETQTPERASCDW